MDILQLLDERTRHNNYDKVDDICDELEILMGGNLGSTPVFYRGNMIIVRRDFFYRLFSIVESGKMVRAVIYLVFCLLALHAPAVPVGRTNHDNSTDLDNLLNWPLGDYYGQGIPREVLVKQFGMDRNILATAMSVLVELEMVVQLPDGTYAFAIDIPETKLENRALARVKDYLSDLVKVVECFQHADLLTSLRNEEDGDPSDEIAFANDDEAADVVASILDGCTIERWVDELSEVIKAHEGDYADNAVAVKVNEFIAGNPYISACGEDFCLIRQEMLEYILLHGYREPLLDGIDSEPISKSAMVVLLYMIIIADEEGYMRNLEQPRMLTQAKDIATDCSLSPASVSKALNCWKSMNVVKMTTLEGAKAIKFSNQLKFSINGQEYDYMDYRKRELGKD